MQDAENTGLKEHVIHPSPPTPDPSLPPDVTVWWGGTQGLEEYVAVVCTGGTRARAVRGWDREGNGFLCLMRPTGGLTEKVESEYLGEPDF